MTLKYLYLSLPNTMVQVNHYVSPEYNEIISFHYTHVFANGGADTRNCMHGKRMMKHKIMALRQIVHPWIVTT